LRSCRPSRRTQYLVWVLKEVNQTNSTIHDLFTGYPPYDGYIQAIGGKVRGKRASLFSPSPATLISGRLRWTRAGKWATRPFEAIDCFLKLSQHKACSLRGHDRRSDPSSERSD
jgi:hypothetical protein